MVECSVELRVGGLAGLHIVDAARAWQGEIWSTVIQTRALYTSKVIESRAGTFLWRDAYHYQRQVIIAKIKQGVYLTFLSSGGWIITGVKSIWACLGFHPFHPSSRRSKLISSRDFLLIATCQWPILCRMLYVLGECEDAHIYLLQGEIMITYFSHWRMERKGLIRPMIPEQHVQDVQGSIDIDIKHRRAREADSFDSSRPGTSRNTIDI